MNARSALAGPDLEARFFLAGADDVEAGPDEAGLLDDSPPPPPLLQMLLPLSCRCSVAEVEVSTDVGSTRRRHQWLRDFAAEWSLQSGLQLCPYQVPRLSLRV